MSVKCPIYLITGFLGSGKSSLLKNFLLQYGATQRIAVIENEYADLSIDAEILSQSDVPFKLIEMNRGSLFCVCQFSNFKSVLHDVRKEYAPDMVIVEATGVADPISIAQLMEDEFIAENFYLAHVFTLVDAVRFPVMVRVAKSVAHQVRVADTILVNKVDLASREVIDGVKVKLNELNPYAQHFEVVNGDIDLQQLLDSADPSRYREIKGELQQCRDSSLFTRVYKSTKMLTEESVREFFNGLSSAIYRVKGYLYIDGHHYIVQYVPGELNMHVCDSAEHFNELIAIGAEMINFRAIEN